MKKTKIDHYTDKEALDFHTKNKPGKIEINSSKPMTTKRDLALAYSPGVAVPVKAISENPEAAYDYTSKGNLVAVISNGSAILGMGNLGALASKPVMEGKAVLFKRFADIDSIDLEIDSNDTSEIINSIKNFSCSFGGINLEDIAAPDCFVIEDKLKEILDIPVFHDDQHGTAIITTAALINALDISSKSIDKIKIVVNGAGASAMACTNLFKNTGVPQKNIIMVDRTGVIYRGRDGLNQWKSSHAVDTKLRTLDEAIDGADVFLGLSAKGALSKDMVKKMAKNPIIFACANPDPEIIELRDLNEEDPAEIEASKHDLAYIKLDGSIGCMVNGAGLAMATMDIIKLYGKEPANFLDVGGGASKEKVSAALKIILSDRNVKGILINIFGGIMRCDVLAQGVVDAAKEINISVPLVVRLAGTNFKKGKEILDNSGLKLISAENLDDAAQKIVEAIK